MELSSTLHPLHTALTASLRNKCGSHGVECKSTNNFFFFFLVSIADLGTWRRTYQYEFTKCSLWAVSSDYYHIIRGNESAVKEMHQLNATCVANACCWSPHFQFRSGQRWYEAALCDRATWHIRSHLHTCDYLGVGGQNVITARLMVCQSSLTS